MKSKEEHTQWCKELALAILEEGDTAGAWACFYREMFAHPEIDIEGGLEFGNTLFLTGQMRDVRGYIEGFR